MLARTKAKFEVLRFFPSTVSFTVWAKEFGPVRWSTIWAVRSPFTSPPHLMVITRRSPLQGSLKPGGAGL